MILKLHTRYFFLFVILFFIKGCGGGGNAPNALSVTPVQNDDLSEPTILNSEIYIPKETFETPEYKNQWGLNFINASDAYSYGASGKGIVIGVVDEALDWGHHEFLKENILHPDSILTYSGGREPTPLEKFHGTATSSIIAGRKDDEPVDRNMHGVAYDAQILFVAIELGSPPSDGEYEPVDIPSFSWERFDEQESNFYKELSSKVDVINNSFGFTGQITDYSKDILENTFPKLINTFATEEDTIFVWSAGNYNGIINTDGEKVDASDPGILAGLSYFFPELGKNNVAVVAVNKDGDIAEFSNRCGVASEFCIAAPGVRVPLAIPNNLFTSLTDIEKEGFNENVLDYLESHPTEAYLLGSGTSFSAPHVTGAIAVLKELFKDNLSSIQILERIFKTANKTGKYSDKEIFGQGLLDLKTASSPVGSALFYTNSDITGSASPAISSYILASKSFGDSLSIGLKNKSVSIFDAYDAPFSVNITQFINRIIPSSSSLGRLSSFQEKKYSYITPRGFEFYSSWKKSLAPYGINFNKINSAKINFQNKNSLISFSYGKNPSVNIFNINEQLLISNIFYDKNAFLNPWLSSVEEGYNIGFSHKFNSLYFDVNIFNGFKRDEDLFLNPSLSFLKKENESKGFFLTLRNKILSNNMMAYTLGFLESNDGFLDNIFNGAFIINDNTKSLFSSFVFKSILSREWYFLGSFNAINLSDIKSNNFIHSISDLTEFSFDIGIIKKSFLYKNDLLSFRIKQDPRIKNAELTLHLPKGRNFKGIINYESLILPISPSGREINFETGWSYQKDNRKLFINLSLIKDKDHISSSDIDISLLFAHQIFF